MGGRQAEGCIGQRPEGLRQLCAQGVHLPLSTWFLLCGFSSSTLSAPPAWSVQLPAPSTLAYSTMAPTVYLSCLLALSVAGLAQGVKGSLRNQVSAPPLCFPRSSLSNTHAWGSPFQKQLPYSHFSERATEAGEVIDVLP